MKLKYILSKISFTWKHTEYRHLPKNNQFVFPLPLETSSLHLFLWLINLQENVGSLNLGENR